MIGSTISEASGVVGVGEGDLEHAVVDEDDIGAVERSNERRRKVSVGAQPRSRPRPLRSTTRLT